MAEFSALPLFTDAWLADTAHLTRLERGVYMDLIILIWRSPGCRVPNDPAWISRKLRICHEEEEILNSVIDEFCQNDGNWVTQKRLSKEHAYVTEKRQKQSDRAKSRWNKEKDICQGNAAPHASGNAPSPSPSPSPSPTKERNSPSESKERNGAGAPGPAHAVPRSRLTDIACWVPGEAERNYAVSHNLDPDRVLADIQDWAANAPASKARKKDPSRFWQTWCRREADKVPRRVNGHGPPGIVASANRVIRRYKDSQNGDFREDSSGTGEVEGDYPPALPGRH